MDPRVFGAIDIGASSGRVVAGVVDTGHVRLEVVHRFPNGATERDGHLRWDLTELYRQVLEGLAVLARRHPGVESVGIDTWAVDYGLLDDRGDLLAEPVSYRDARCVHAAQDFERRWPREEVFGVNGLQHLPFTTVHQLWAERSSALWPRLRHVVLLPDLLAYWLTGALSTERTNASTTGLLDAVTGTWSHALLDTIELPEEALPPLADPGSVRGPLTPELCTRTGLPAGCVVTTVASHDTASAVVGVPATSDRFAYVSSGTWSLVGVELPSPVLTAGARTGGFTNEAGVDGTTRFLRNVGGLWLLQESVRQWRREGLAVDETDLLTAAAALPPGGPVVDVDDPGLIPPGDMPARLRVAAGRRGASLDEPAAVARCVLDSLAHAYARTVADAQTVTERPVEVVHVVGGGSQNELLCRLTADVSGLPVLAGPVEATALGNVMVQARAHGALTGDLATLRAETLARWGTAPRRYEPASPG
ncbi:rhamnulokinase family protein [Arthrobacter sp. NEB 688]|uniref:rhamnulokinase n=1 Tax=Arthrobacter sp. NEB 688 TaxID=904039 RepID=UPI001565F898|nr:rhamnulokinase family protein [Arthrobacter sp. NEB 688]QKE84502.1 rhamnulokinase [Arthrobacter sp. NEB 688]